MPFLKNLLLLVSIFSIVCPALAEEELTLDKIGEVPELSPSQSPSQSRSFLIGHNLTPTTDMLRRGDWTVGTYAISYGITDHFFLATSPWIWLSYNTANVHLKWADDVTENSRVGFFASYFESYNSTPLLTKEVTGSNAICRGRNCVTPPGQVQTQPAPANASLEGPLRYQWKSYSLHGLYSYKYESGNITYVSFKYSYFWNDDLPYSIRMDPGSDTIRNQLDLTTLTEFPVADSKWWWGFEFGAVGLNYLAPYMQLGLSVAYKSDSWLVQIGASDTAQFRELGQTSAWIPGRYDTRLHYSTSQNEYYYYRYLQTALHPEIQLQYFF